MRPQDCLAARPRDVQNELADLAVAIIEPLTVEAPFWPYALPLELAAAATWKNRKQAQLDATAGLQITKACQRIERFSNLDAPVHVITDDVNHTHFADGLSELLFIFVVGADSCSVASGARLIIVAGRQAPWLSSSPVAIHASHTLPPLTSAND
jgi:hypothetical protein